MTRRVSRKVLAGGVFNIIHKGHELFLRRAREKGDFLVVVIASDETAGKSKEYPLKSQEERKKNVESLGIADKVIIGDPDNFMVPVRNERPDLIVLGYDQEMTESELGRMLSEEGIDCEVERIKEHLSGHKTSELMKNNKV